MKVTETKEYKLHFSRLASRATVAVAATLAAGLSTAAVALYHALSVPPLTLLYALLAAELIFATCFQLRKAQLNRNVREQRPSEYDGDAVFQRFLDACPQLLSYMCPRSFFTRWFFNADFDHICKGNVEELVAWGFFYRPREWFYANGKGDELRSMVEGIEQAWGLEFPAGHNPQLRMMAHLWEPLPCHYRPLGWYLLTEFLAALKHMVLLAYGFRHHTMHGYSYYTYNLPGSGDAPAAASRPSASGAGSKAPLLFLHGVGLGLLPYLPLLQRFAATGHPLIAVESKHLAMRFTLRLPSVDQVVAAVMDITAAHGVHHFSVVGHSYGTLMASRLVQQHPRAVHSLTLIDPVCFCMFSGHLVKNFVYGWPETLGQISTWMVSREMHTCASVTRQFYWSLLNLWPEDLPRELLVVVSENDALVPVPMVQAMLAAEAEATVLHHPTHAHADFIADMAWQDDITVAVVKLMARASMSAHMRHDSASSYTSLHREGSKKLA